MGDSLGCQLVEVVADSARAVSFRFTTSTFSSPAIVPAVFSSITPVPPNAVEDAQMARKAENQDQSERKQERCFACLVPHPPNAEQCARGAKECQLVESLFRDAIRSPLGQSLVDREARQRKAVQNGEDSDNRSKHEGFRRSDKS